MLSTPVWGVESKKAVAAARLAPCRRIEATTGITLHEQSGNGTPNNVAFTTGPKPGPPRCRSVHSAEIHVESKPANAKPKSKKGDISPRTSQVAKATCHPTTAIMSM
jgi:hypothetical protein